MTVWIYTGANFNYNPTISIKHLRFKKMLYILCKDNVNEHKRLPTNQPLSKAEKQGTGQLWAKWPEILSIFHRAMS